MESYTYERQLIAIFKQLNVPAAQSKSRSFAKANCRFQGGFHGDSTHVSQSPILCRCRPVCRERVLSTVERSVRRGICSAAIPDRYLECKTQRHARHVASSP
ncbi:hypothetical protein KCP70_18165 [Salmonella enterica subsp. enterica]|nr:hypothetical protein KCP70_18165 [Salmonella enterica subsp. enterica]